MASMCILTMLPINALAASTGSDASDITLGEDKAQSAKTTYAEIKDESAQTKVYLTVDDKDLVVSVPTTIIVSGTPTADGSYVGNYSVGVSGDLSGDKTVAVAPETDAVTLKQKGKLDKSANITQTQTTFSSTDFANHAKATGQVKANALTAGSWSSVTNFVITPTQKAVYYSSIERAIADVNAQSTDGADVKRSNAEDAAVAVSTWNGKTVINVLKDVSNVQSFTVSKDAEMDLNGHTIEFAPKQYMTYEKSLTLKNGSMVGKNAQYILLCAKSNTNSNTVIKNIAFEGTVNSNIGAAAILSDISSKTATLDNVSYTQSGTGNASYNTNCSIFRGNNLTANNVKFNIDISDNNITRGAQWSGDVVATKCSANVKAKTNACQAFYFNGNSAKNATVRLTDVYAHVTTETTKDNSYAIGVYCKNVGTLNVLGAEILAEDMTHVYASGISSSDINTEASITATSDHPVNVFGKHWGVSLIAPKVMINGGVYTSQNHCGYFGGSCEIRNAKFYADRFDKYPLTQNVSGQHFGPLYFGSESTTSKDVANLYNCQLGEPNQKQYAYNTALVAQHNYNCTAPGTINLYDCTVYQGTKLFSFQGVSGNIMSTKINLYGDTVLYSNDKKVISKDEFAKANTDWQHQTYSTGSGVTELIGNSYVSGWAHLENGVVKEIFESDDCGVYDYR